MRHNYVGLKGVDGRIGRTSVTANLHHTEQLPSLLETSQEFGTCIQSLRNVVKEAGCAGGVLITALMDAFTEVNKQLEVYEWFVSPMM